MSLEIITEQVHNGYNDQLSTIQYTQSQMVGHGSFGVVFETKILPLDQRFAIKRVLQDKRFKNRELQIMKLIHHRNIVDLKYYFYKNEEAKDELYLNLILEFIPETLYKASHFYVSKRLLMPLLEIKLYSYQMFRALNFIHIQGICHRDIKPQNLLINPFTGELKLCDFGSAKILNPKEPNVSYICSRYYRAPELIFGSVNYTTKIDIWSAGCVIAELILGQPLFPGESGIDQLVEIIKILGTPSKDQIKHMNPNYMDHKFPSIKPIPLNKIFKKIPPDFIAFLAKILQYNPLERINSFDAMLDPYFNELRAPDLKLPNFRKLFENNGSDPELNAMPELFDFDVVELSAYPHLNNQLVPNWAHSKLNINVPLSEFIPLSQEDIKINQLI